MKKRLISVLFVLITLLTAGTAYASHNTAVKLPDINGWMNGKIQITSIETVSGYKGSWQERDYRDESGTPYHAVWIDGAGEKQWNIEKVDGIKNDGAIGSNSTYKTITILNNTAALEKHPVIGRSLTVKIKNKGTLTLESVIADDNEIIRTAELIIKNL